MIHMYVFTYLYIYIYIYIYIFTYRHPLDSSEVIQVSNNLTFDYILTKANNVHLISEIKNRLSIIYVYIGIYF